MRPLRVASLLSMLALAACAIDPTADPAPPAVCGPGASPSRLSANGIQANGVQLNGIWQNGIQANGIQTNGTSLVGVRVAGAPAVGAAVTAVMKDGTDIDLVITAEEDGLFELTRDGVNVCANGDKGLFVDGVWDARGARHESDTLSTFSCRTGAIAKCVLMGYDPARVGAAAHQACTRMVRADYCGDGVSSTRDGTIIDVFDTEGVQSAANLPGFAFEAGWTENGAACVNRPRIAAAVPSCFRDLPACRTASEAIQHGATLLNASRPTCQ